MTTKPQSKIVTSGRLNGSTRPIPHSTAEVAKVVLYMTPDVLAGLLEAVAAVTPDQLKGVAKGGNHNGRCLAVIAREWMKGRVK